MGSPPGFVGSPPELVLLLEFVAWVRWFVGSPTGFAARFVWFLLGFVLVFVWKEKKKREEDWLISSPEEVEEEEEAEKIGVIE
ncbi:hypothetical protein CFP56_022292 [Quercus suber]|uniref:Transmembrane protein n=1 Tax=Quercus suber TaxID=58331 RepID=A0AAW0KC87_QUESU